MRPGRLGQGRQGRWKTFQSERSSWSSLTPRVPAISGRCVSRYFGEGRERPNTRFERGCPRTGESGRHHVQKSIVQRAVRKAAVVATVLAGFTDGENSCHLYNSPRRLSEMSLGARYSNRYNHLPAAAEMYVGAVVVVVDCLLITTSRSCSGFRDQHATPRNSSPCGVCT